MKAFALALLMTVSGGTAFAGSTIATVVGHYTYQVGEIETFLGFKIPGTQTTETRVVYVTNDSRGLVFDSNGQLEVFELRASGSAKPRLGTMLGSLKFNRFGDDGDRAFENPAPVEGMLMNASEQCPTTLSTDVTFGGDAVLNAETCQ